MKKPIKTTETVRKGGQIVKDIKSGKGSGAGAPADNTVKEEGDNG